MFLNAVNSLLIGGESLIITDFQGDRVRENEMSLVLWRCSVATVTSVTDAEGHGNLVAPSDFKLEFPVLVH